MSQRDEILKELKSGQPITPMKALYKFGCFRLGARIHELKNRGFNIHSELITRNGRRFAEYSLIK